MTSSIKQLSWTLVFASALGVILGVVLSSGVHFDKSDTARFLGSLIGSFVAVGGAVSLHYVRESEIKNTRRRHFLAILEITKGYADQSVGFIKRNESVHSAIDTFRNQYSRLRRFAVKFEFDDYGIGEALVMLSIWPEEMFSYPKDVELDEEFRAKMAELIGGMKRPIGEAILRLHSSDHHLKVLS